MTLLTHFRNKKYAVVACDRQLTNDNGSIYGYSPKIRVAALNTKIFGNYGKIIDAFLPNSELETQHLTKERIKKQLKDLVRKDWYKGPGSGILIVNSSQSILLFKRKLVNDEDVWEIGVNSLEQIDYKKIKLAQDIKTILIHLCKSHIFFNLDNFNNHDLFMHQDFLVKFLASYFEINDKEFNIENFEKENLRSVFKIYYSRIYSDMKYRKSIGGNVDIMILDIEKGRINHEDEIVITNDEIQQQIDEWKKEITLNDINEFL